MGLQLGYGGWELLEQNLCMPGNGASFGFIDHVWMAGTFAQMFRRKRALWKSSCQSQIWQENVYRVEHLTTHCGEGTLGSRQLSRTAEPHRAPVSRSFFFHQEKFVFKPVSLSEYFLFKNHDPGAREMA